MKKLKLLVVALLLFIPTKVLGFGIKDYYINATVEKNGDLTVEEYFSMNGEYNGSERVIDYRNIYAYTFNPDAPSYGGHSLHNGNGVILDDIRAVDVDSNFDFNNISGTKFKLVSSANKGDYGVYTVDRTSTGITTRIFLPNNKNKAFYLKYRLQNMAILHNDVGELGWNFIGSQFRESIENLVVYVNVPNNKTTMKVWAHGPLNGTSEILSQNKVKASIYALNDHTAVDIRMAFDKEAISDSTKKSNVDALEKIIKYEEDEAERANESRRRSDESYTSMIESGFYMLNKIPSRKNYDSVEENIAYLNNSDKKEEFYKKLIEYKPKVDEYEYKEFKRILNEKDDINRLLVGTILSRNKYDKAMEYVHNVFSSEIKDEMYKELDDYYKKLQINDYKDELILSIISIITLGITIIVYKKPIKLKKKVDPMYFRDIPADLSPSAVGILVDKKINQNEVSASILDLVRRKIISVEKQKNDSYDFILNKTYEEMSELDQSICLLLFHNRSSKRVNSKNVKKITFSSFDKYKKQITKELEDKKYMKDYVPALDEINGILFELGLILCFTPLIFIGILLIFLYSLMRYHGNFYIWILKIINFIIICVSTMLNSTVFHFSVVFGIISIIYISRALKKIPIKLNIKYTEEGKKEYVKWNGLRNFLLDFSKIDTREIKEVSIWEQYLVYATALGVGDKVLKQIKLHIQQFDNIDYSILNDMVTIDHISSSVNRISDSVVSSSLPKTSFPIANAMISSSGGSYSSGGGGGGGFSGGSSGGGSFGGGGGGGRF